MTTIKRTIEDEIKRQYETGTINLDKLVIALRKYQLGNEYFNLVGYNPFIDDLAQAIEEVEKLLFEARVELIKGSSVDD